MKCTVHCVNYSMSRVSFINFFNCTVTKRARQKIRKSDSLEFCISWEQRFPNLRGSQVIYKWQKLIGLFKLKFVLFFHLKEMSIILFVCS